MKWKTLILFCRILLIASQKPVIFICCKIGGHTCQIQSKRTTSINLAVSSDGFLFKQMMKLSNRDFLTNIWVDLKITIQPVWVRIFFDKQWAAHDIFSLWTQSVVRGDIIEKKHGTLGCQINDSTRLSFSHFFHPALIANFLSYSFIRHFFLDFQLWPYSFYWHLQGMR